MSGRCRLPDPQKEFERPPWVVRCEWSAPHVREFVYLYAPADGVMGGNFKRVHLFDLECSVGWASQVETTTCREYLEPISPFCQ